MLGLYVRFGAGVRITHVETIACSPCCSTLPCITLVMVEMLYVVVENICENT
jgi:hypothetical protein